MLIRLVGHFINNSMHIDKLICIKGLPEEWLFRKRGEDKELNPPFTADNPDNIPKYIRHLCVPAEVVKYFPPIEKGREGVLDRMTVLAVKLDYMTEAGREMWVKIERYVDSLLPRHTKMPEPVVVAKDQKSQFETYSLHRRVTGGVEMAIAEIPVIDLLDIDGKAPPATISPLVDRITPPIATAVSSPPVPPEAILFKCKSCEYSTPKAQALRMHSLKHRKGEKVSA